MPSTGFLQIYAYTSNARIPLKDAAITIEDSSNRLLAMGLTDRNGKFGPLPIDVPDRQESLTPEAYNRPYSTVNILARLEGFEQIEADNVQLFANETTVQNLELIPLSEFPDQWTKSERFNTPPQNL